jgi:hypothetical protein
VDDRGTKYAEAACELAKETHGPAEERANRRIGGGSEEWRAELAASIRHNVSD